MSQLKLAIVGVSALFPGSQDSAGFWQDILAGRDLITDVPPERWLLDDYYDADPSAPDKTYSRRGAFLGPTPFDPLSFGMPPATLPGTDSAQLLALVVARAVLQDAGKAKMSAALKAKTSVILGVTGGQELMGTLAARLGRPQWRHALRQHGLPESEVEAICDRISATYVPWQEASFPGLLGNVVAGRIAHRLDLHGTNCVVDAACASALSALRMAAQELALGHSDMVIAGGVDTLSDPFMYMCFSKTPALSKTGDCRPFSADCDGTVLGEGLCMVALRRLADAERDGDRIYAVLQGLGASSDGLGPGIYAPVSEGQALALTRAWEEAEFAPESLGLIEAHGTGTKAGDAAELKGLALAFGEAPAHVALGSVKSQIGHTKAAAGAAGLFKAVLALHHKVLPPTIKVTKAHEALPDGGPLYLNTTARPWVHGKDTPRRAGVSAFGFGGSDFHAALEEYTGSARPPRLERWPAEIFVLAGADTAALLTQASAMLTELEAGENWAALCWRSQEDARKVAPARLAGLATDGADLAKKLSYVVERLPSRATLPPGLHLGEGSRSGKLAFLFPGQGSQHLGMGAALAMSDETARAAWDLAERVSTGWGQTLGQVVFPPAPLDDSARAAQIAHLTETQWAQPALAAASLALLNILNKLGVHPDLCAGHSFGELSALHAGGAICSEDLIALARARGEAMAEAGRLRAGGMVAALGSAERARAELAALHAAGRATGVVIANDNAPDQVVLSGPTDGLEDVEAALGLAGLQTRRLAVSTAFHAPMIAGATTAFDAALAGVDLENLDRVVYSGVTAEAHADCAVREALSSALSHPVRFREVVAAMIRDGARTFVEVGPGGVLSGLVRRCNADSELRVVSLDAPGQDARLGLLGGLAALIAAGVPMDLATLRAERRAPVTPVTPGKFTVYLTGSNPGAPYPPKGGAAKPNPERAAVAKPAAVLAPPVVAAPVVAPKVAPAPSPILSKHVQLKEKREESPMSQPNHGSQQSLVAPAGDGWVQAARELQQQTAATHASFVAAMHHSHLAYLRTVELSVSGLVAMAGAQPHATTLLQPAQWAPQQIAMAPAPQVMVPAPVMAPVAATPVQMAAPVRPAQVPVAPAPVAAAPVAKPAPASRLAERAVSGDLSGILAAPAPKAPPAAAAPAPKPAASDAPELSELLLQVVADRTGYPAEMLNLDMSLAADLGIDSIKRVEILSALRAAVPSLPELDVSQVAGLKTLAAVLGALEAASAPRRNGLSNGHEDRRLLLAGSSETSVELPLSAPTPAPRPRPGVAMPGIQGLTGILPDASGVAEKLAAKLRAAGHGVEIIADAAAPPKASALVLLGGLGPFADDDAARSALHEAFCLLSAVAKKPPQGLLSAARTGGRLDLAAVSANQAIAAGFAGLVRTAGREWSDTTARVLDLGPMSDDAAADAILAELVAGGDDPDVSLNAGGRYGLLDLPLVTPTRGETLKDGDVVVITGGARGVTAWCAVALAGAMRLKLALIGRTPLLSESSVTAGIEGDAALKRALLMAAKARGEALSPASLGGEVGRILAAREVAETLRQIAASGSEARYLAVDVQNRAALGDALETLRAWGPIGGVVHGAGIILDASLGDKSEADFERVLSTKVDGFRALLDLTRADPLRLLCAFSSVSARHGNRGQADYAAANEILTAMCAAESRPGLRALSLLWGPWEGGMVTPALAGLFAARGVPLIGREAGSAAFVALALAADGPGAVLLGGGLEAPETRAEPATTAVQISAVSRPYLRDHRVKDVAVLPAVEVVERFARVAAGRWGLYGISIHDLRVLRGVELPGLDAGEETGLQITARPRGDGLELMLRGERPAYSAWATAAAAPGAVPALVGALVDLPEDPYQNVLFHGPAFQALSAVQVGDAGAGALVAPILGQNGPETGWSDLSFAVDIRALDAALQLALVWTGVRLGRRSLPTGVKEISVYQAGPWSGPVRARLIGRAVEAQSTRCDIWLLADDPSGPRPLARLLGVEVHALAESIVRAAALPADLR